MYLFCVFAVIFFGWTRTSISADEVCHSSDLLILIDSSGDISCDDWANMLQFLINILHPDYFNLNSASHQIFIIQYSNMQTFEFQLDATKNTSVALANLDRHTSSVSDLVEALDLVARYFQNVDIEDRVDVRNKILILTAKTAASDKQGSMKYSERLKFACKRVQTNHKARIYVVGVKEANVAQMRIVSSSPQLADNNYWYRNETTELADIVTPIRNSICEDPIEDIHGSQACMDDRTDGYCYRRSFEDMVNLYLEPDDPEEMMTKYGFDELDQNLHLLQDFTNRSMTTGDLEVSIKMVLKFMEIWEFNHWWNINMKTVNAMTNILNYIGQSDKWKKLITHNTGIDHALLFVQSSRYFTLIMNRLSLKRQETFGYKYFEMLVTPVTPASALTINDLTFFHGWVMTRIPVATILDLQITNNYQRAVVSSTYYEELEDYIFHESGTIKRLVVLQSTMAEASPQLKENLTIHFTLFELEFGESLNCTVQRTSMSRWELCSITITEDWFICNCSCFGAIALVSKKTVPELSMKIFIDFYEGFGVIKTTLFIMIVCLFTIVIIIAETCYRNRGVSVEAPAVTSVLSCVCHILICIADIMLPDNDLTEKVSCYGFGGAVYVAYISWVGLSASLTLRKSFCLLDDTKDPSVTIQIIVATTYLGVRIPNVRLTFQDDATVYTRYAGVMSGLLYYGLLNDDTDRCHWLVDEQDTNWLFRGPMLNLNVVTGFYVCIIISNCRPSKFKLLVGVHAFAALIMLIGQGLSLYSWIGSNDKKGLYTECQSNIATRSCLNCFCFLIHNQQTLRFLEYIRDYRAAKRDMEFFRQHIENETPQQEAALYWEFR